MLRTACYDWHVTHGGRMVDFAGWKMPVQYSSITEEHHAVRKSAGVFDIAHMGRLAFTGPDACGFVDHLVTNDVTKLQPGQIRYALVTNQQGGILDDVLVYRFSDFYLMVVNASNRLKILNWVEEHQGGFDVHLADLTFERFMLALQGPRAVELLDPLVNCDVDQISYYWGAEAAVLNIPGLVSRTGYTGEDGFEVILPAEHGPRLWEAIIDRGSQFGLLPCGLGCRDTLRLEAAMPLYGHELDESTDPISAGLSFAVKFKAGDFIGKQALVRAKSESKKGQRRVGLVLAGRRIAREGAPVYVGEQQIGRVTSGTFSPTLEKPIAMAYIDAAYSESGMTVDVEIRGKRHSGDVVALPFYKRGWRE